MYRYKLLLLITLRKLSSVFWNIALLFKGQSRPSNILMVSHRLEKGLCISNPRPMWGWEKAEELATLLIKESGDLFSKETGLAVLHAYLDHKHESTNEEDAQRLKAFETRYNAILNQPYDAEKGGSISISKEDLVFEGSIKKLFYSRHSIRDFESTEVPVEKIIKAIELANRCPSACNRQPSHIYVIPDEIWRKYTHDSNQVYNANKHLLVTADKTAYSLNEIDDWIVSASIFAAYLSLSLTAVGIGSCVIKKGLIDDKHYKRLKERCSIPKTEKIILEIAIGNYKDSFRVPVSNRKPTVDLFSIIK